MQRPQIVNNEIYHVYNRGVEKRKIFLDTSDYLRGIHDLFEFNDANPTSKLYIPRNQISEVGLPKILPRVIELRAREPRKLLVEILAFCFMPNHIHFMLRQKITNGITEFMRKFGTGYTNYFNQKYERVGSLFQGVYKLVHVKRESHFIHLPFYIHANPLDMVMKGWRKGEIPNVKKAMRILEGYRWSSYPDYIGKKNFPSVTQREFLLDLCGGSVHYKKEMRQWFQAMELENMNDLLLE